MVIGKFPLLHSLPPMHGQVTLIKLSVCHAEGDIKVGRRPMKKGSRRIENGMRKRNRGESYKNPLYKYIKLPNNKKDFKKQIECI